MNSVYPLKDNVNPSRRETSNAHRTLNNIGNFLYVYFTSLGLLTYYCLVLQLVSFVVLPAGPVYICPPVYERNGGNSIPTGIALNILLCFHNMTSKYDFAVDGFWKRGKIIGTGGSSTVYEATILHNNEIIAAKEIHIDGLTKDQVLAIEAEVNTIKSLEHNHIVNYLGTQLRGHYFYIFLEHADRGSLRQYYRKHGKLLEPEVACCTKQLLLGLLYLHGNNIAHRDIKGANVLLTNAGELKLADFGASKRYDTASIVSGLKGNA